MGNKTLTHENFDKRELPKGFKPEIQNLVLVSPNELQAFRELVVEEFADEEAS